MFVHIIDIYTKKIGNYIRGTSAGAAMKRLSCPGKMHVGPGNFHVLFFLDFHLPLEAIYRAAQAAWRRGTTSFGTFRAVSVSQKIIIPIPY
jgi:FAD/FMN-containing dehydrogenase